MSGPFAGVRPGTRLTRSRAARAASATLADVIERLKHSDRLLMLDNADVLHPDVYPLIMALHDVARIALLIVRTYKLL